MFESKLDAMAREKVERTINAMPDAEADEIANAAGYERRTGRKAFRAGHYGRTLAAKAGKLSLKAPELKGALFGSTVTERCRRRESSVEEALMEMYLAGVGTRRVDDTGRLLWGGRVENAGVLVAIGVGTEGRREAIAVDEGMREDAAGRERFFRSMIERGSRGVGPVVGDRCAGLVSTVNSMPPNARCQRRMVRFMRDAPSKTPPGHREWASAALKAVFAQENRESAMAQGRDGRGRNGGTQAQVGREPPARGRRRDRRLPPAGVPREPWDQAAHEQHDRAIEQGDPPAHPGRGRLPRLRQRAHARMRRNPLRHLTLMVGPAIHGHVPAR